MLRRNEKVEWIKHAPLFANLSKRDLAEVAHLADELDLREGKEMTRQGAPAREFFVLLEGEADVRKNGRRINQLGPGDFFGEIALVSDRPRLSAAPEGAAGHPEQGARRGRGAPTRRRLGSELGAKPLSERRDDALA